MWRAHRHTAHAGNVGQLARASGTGGKALLKTIAIATGMRTYVAYPIQ